MKQVSAQSGDFIVKVQESISSFLVTSSTKITAGTVTVSKKTDNGKVELIPEMDLIHAAEVSTHGLIILKTAESSLSVQLSEFGNIENLGDEYILLEFSGVTAATSGTVDVYTQSEFYSPTMPNVITEGIVQDGSKSDEMLLNAANEVHIPVDTAVKSIELKRGGEVRQLDYAELKAEARRNRPMNFYIQESTADAGFKNYFLIKTDGAEKLRVLTDGSKAIRYYLNRFGQ